MIIYKDVFSKDELFSEANAPEVIDDVMYKVTVSNIKRTTKLDSSLFGNSGNVNPLDGTSKPAEQDDEELVESGIELVLNYLYQPYHVDLKTYKSDVRSYLKRLKEYIQAKNPDRLEAFQKGATSFFTNFIIPNFDKIECYLGENADDTAMIILCHSNGDQYDFYFWKDGAFTQKY